MKNFNFVILFFMFTVSIFVQSSFSETQLQQIIARAQQGDPQSEYELASIYENGRGVKKDFAEALRWYEKAAEQGHIGAQIDLGWFYQSGEGVNKDINKAIDFYEKAAQQGNSQAQLNLGVLYDEGVDVSENNKLAVEWYKKSADQGNEIAMLKLGVCYWKGKGVPQDNEKAWNLLNQVRMTASNKKAQWKARGILEEMKGKLGIKNGEFSYPNWDKLKKN